MERPESARRGLEDLEGRVCLVTGASQGIGYATATELAGRGARVVLTSTDGARARARASQAADETQGQLLGLKLDVTDPDSIQQMLVAVKDWTHGKAPQVLVNNAGLPVEPALWNTPFHEVPADRLAEWFQRVHAVDVAGARNVTHAVLPAMMDAREGAIVFLSSTPALAGHHATPYTEAKAALLGLMRDTAVNYARFNIRANAVAPGNIRTSWFDKNSPEQQEQLRLESPMARWGDPEEVARVIAFFASPQSSFVTGQTLVIDGGKVIH